MRLTPEETAQIVVALSSFVGKNSAELRLYGSRVDDQQKGGDIDLLLIVDSEALENQLQVNKHFILAAIKELIGDQKIDLKIVQVNEIEHDDFLQLIYPKALVLHIWN